MPGHKKILWTNDQIGFKRSTYEFSSENKILKALFWVLGTGFLLLGAGHNRQDKKSYSKDGRPPSRLPN